MKDKNINIEVLRSQALTMAAKIMSPPELHRLYDICETQKTVSVNIVYRQLEKHHNNLCDAAVMIRKLCDQL